MAMNSEMPKKAGLKLGSGRSSSMTESTKSKSVRPKNVNKNIKVSQSEINSIKKLGMKKALSIAAMNKDSVQEGAVASFAEGVRRLYGETRYQNAIYTPKASPGPIGSASNVREGRSTAKASPKPSAANLREDRGTASATLRRLNKSVRRTGRGD